MKRHHGVNLLLKRANFREIPLDDVIAIDRKLANVIIYKDYGARPQWALTRFRTFAKKQKEIRLKYLKRVFFFNVILDVFDGLDLRVTRKINEINIWIAGKRYAQTFFVRVLIFFTLAREGTAVSRFGNQTSTQRRYDTPVLHCVRSLIKTTNPSKIPRHLRLQQNVHLD